MAFFDTLGFVPRFPSRFWQLDNFRMSITAQRDLTRHVDLPTQSLDRSRVHILHGGQCLYAHRSSFLQVLKKNRRGDTTPIERISLTVHVFEESLSENHRAKLTTGTFLA